MFESIDRMLMAGLGAMSMSRERAEKMFDDMVQRGQAAREGKHGFVQEMMESAERTRKELERTVREQTRQVVETMNLATKDDIARLEAAIRECKEASGKQEG